MNSVRTAVLSNVLVNLFLCYELSRQFNNNNNNSNDNFYGANGE